MNNLFKLAAVIAAAAMFRVCGGREAVTEVFGSNVGLDSLSRAVEVAVMKSEAAFVFNAEKSNADEC